MKPESKIKVLAELDGWIFYQSKDNGFGQARPEFWQNEDTGEQVWENHPKFKPYLTSYDAIVHLVVKWCGDDYSHGGKWDRFVESLWEFLGIDSDFSEQEAWRYLFQKGTPEQLSDALIHATGKWQEE